MNADHDTHSPAIRALFFPTTGKGEQPNILYPDASWDDIGVSKNRGIPKWMVYSGNPYQNG